MTPDPHRRAFSVSGCSDRPHPSAPVRGSERTATAGGAEQDGDGGVRLGCGFRSFSGVDGYCIRGCRGRPMCRPVGGSREEACPGGHTGPPLRGVGRRSKVNGNWHETTPSPAGRDGARPLQGGAEQEGVSRTAGCTWGVASASQIPKRNLGRQSWSPRPTGATLVVPSSGPMYLRHGFRQANSVPKFGTSVKSSRPTGDCSLVEREPLGRVRGLFFLPFPGRLGRPGSWGTGCFFGGCPRSGPRRTPPPGGRRWR